MVERKCFANEFGKNYGYFAKYAQGIAFCVARIRSLLRVSTPVMRNQLGQGPRALAKGPFHCVVLFAQSA